MTTARAKGRANSTRRMRRTDISGIETGLDAVRDETRVLGKPAAEVAADELFFIDRLAGAPRVGTRRGRIDDVITPDSRTPALHKERVIGAVSADVALVSRMAKRTVGSAKQVHAAKPALADLWADDSAPASKKAAKRLSVVPHSGSSYRPESTSHAALVGAAESVEMQRLAAVEAVRRRMPAEPVLDALFRRAVDIGQMLDEKPVDEGVSVSASLLAAPATRKKTRKERNKERREREALAVEKQAAKDATLHAAIEALPADSIATGVVETPMAKTARRPAVRRVKSAPIAVALPEEIAESLRTVRPESELLVTDRVRALQSRGLVAPLGPRRRGRFAF